MSTTNAPRWIFDASDPAKRGLLKAFGDTTPQTAENFIRFGASEKLMRIVRNTGNEDNPHEDIDLTGATITVAAGPLDSFPTSGNSRGEYNGDDTGIDEIPAGISAADLQTALNANPGIFGEGGVTVELVRGAYRIEWNNPGNRGLLEWFGGSLTPPARVKVVTDIEGDATTNEVKVLTIYQDYWALNSVWDVEAAGSVARTVLIQGAAAEREVVRIVITGNPTGGKWRVTAPQAAVHKVSCVANSGANYAEYEWQFAGNTIVSGDYHDIYDAAGPVRVWFNIAGAGPAPAAPAGGRLKEIASGSTLPDVLGANLWGAFIVDSGLTPNGTTFGYSFVKIRTNTLGAFTVPVAPGFTTFEFRQGNAGRLDSKYFSLYDAGGQVGVWFNLSSISTMPAAVAAMSRQIEVTGIAANATSTTVAAAVASALDADASFGAVSATNVVTVTDVNGGARGNPNNGDSLCGVTQSKPGYIISATLPHNATAPQVRDAFGGIYDVTVTIEPDQTEYILTAVNVGELTDITATDQSLTFAAFYRGTLSFNTATVRQAFLDLITGDELNGKLEAQYQFPGEDPVKFFQAPLTLLRSLIDTTELSPLNQLAGTYQDGAENIGIAADFLDVVFDAPFASEDWTLLASNISNDVDAPPPELLFPTTIANKTAAGFRIYFNGGPSTANYVYNYMARL